MVEEEIKKMLGVKIFAPNVYLDRRGYFIELFNNLRFNDNFLDNISFEQDNFSCSNKNVLRGLHFQSPPYSQGKLIQVLQGRILDVIVDIRKASKTYGEHIKFELSAENHKQLWIPPGFAHGFLTLEDKTLFSYKCTNYYSKEHEMDLLWNDVDLDIHWGIENPIISEKDQNANKFKNFDSPF